MDAGSFPGPETLVYLGLLVVPGWLSRLLCRRHLGSHPEPVGHELLATVSLSLLLSSVSLLLSPLPLLDVPALVPAWLFLALVVVPAVAAYLYAWCRTGRRPNLLGFVLGSAPRKTDPAAAKHGSESA